MLVVLARAFLSGLLVWAFVVGLVGLVLAAASASLLERVPLKATYDRVEHWLVGAQPRMRVRLLRGVLGILLGCAIVFWPQEAPAIAATLAGCVIVFAGLREALVAALHLLPAMEPRERVPGTAATTRQSAAITFVSLTALALIVVTAFAVLRRPDTPVMAEPVTAYNGLPQLGDRTLDQVVFPRRTTPWVARASPTGCSPTERVDRGPAHGRRARLPIDIRYGVPPGNTSRRRWTAGPACRSTRRRSAPKAWKPRCGSATA